MTTCLLDTNIFIYAAGSPHAHKQPCVDILRSVAQGELGATTNTEVLQEVMHLFSRRRRREQGVQLCRSIVDMLPGILPIDNRVMTRVFDLAGTYPDHSIRDLVHVAVMQANGIPTICSVDADFDRIQGIERLIP
jgi:predicted nucleic acid-binding protein